MSGLGTEEISHLIAEGDKGTRGKGEGGSMRPCASKAGASGKHKGVLSPGVFAPANNIGYMEPSDLLL